MGRKCNNKKRYQEGGDQTTIYPNEQLAREGSEKRVQKIFMEKADYEFSDENYSLSEDINPAVTEKMLWALEQDNETGFVIVEPMNGEKLVIHGKQEAEMFCRDLIGCFR